MFMDKKIVAKIQKLKRPVVVRNMNRINNSAGAITPGRN